MDLTGLDESAFDSPIEEELSRVLQKYLNNEAKLENQRCIVTPNGKFRLDFAITIGEKCIALEANGRAFHEYETDIFRGALILGYSDINSIYYIRGSDIWYNLSSALFAISNRERDVFSERGLHNLKNLSKSSESNWEEYSCSDWFSAALTSKSEAEWKKVYDVTFLSKNMKNPIWKRIFDFTRGNPELSVQELVEKARVEKLDIYSD